MYELIQQLKSEPSTNKKLEILQSYSNDNNVKEALKLTYDPFIRFYINKIAKRNKDLPKPLLTIFNNHSFSEFKKLASALSERRITGNDAIAATHLFLDACSDELREAFSLILKKDLKVGISIKTLQKAFGEDFIEDFNVQLANTYDKTKNYKINHWYASPKLDGLRCYFTHGKLLTRNGHEIMGFEHIIEELNSIVLYDEFKPDFIDGELYTNEVNFQEIQGAVMSNKNIDPERKSKIKYNIFALGCKNIKTTDDMVEDLYEIFNKNTFKYLVKVPYHYIINKSDEIVKYCEMFMQEGYEGVMLRDPIKPYDWKRSNALLKFKLFKEADFTIVGFYEGKDKYEGTLGGLIVSGEYTDEEKNITYTIKSEVGSGFSDALRDEIWENRNEYLEKIAEIKFQNVTDEPDKNGAFSLRFPVFLKTKEDR